ncbi:MAG TPA: TonB-dependent receptor, partial [Chitinophagaceae bacterium]|nr:TonB-dependent receptor [Chitinophagaceae bacterium]
MFLFPTFYARSQRLDVTGKITNTKSEAIDGAVVYVLNTNLFALTDAGGNFVLRQLGGGNYVLRIKALGFAEMNIEITVNASLKPLQLALQESTAQLDDVTVSAQKKEELLQKIPFSVSAFNERQVNEYRLWNSKDITAIVPNLYSADPGDGRNVTSIRGITTTSYEPAVTTYIDGVSQFTLDTYIPQLFDVQSIEVLRGPQGTLYGRNATGGIINIITKKPVNKTTAFGEASIGNYGLQRYVAGIKTPLIKNKLFFGAALMHEEIDGYYTNDFYNTHFDERNSFGGNYYLKFYAGSKWSVTLNAKHIFNKNKGSFPLNPSKEDAFANPFHLNQDAVSKLKDYVFNGSLSVNYSGAGFNFSSQTAYQNNYRFYAQPIDGDFSPIDGITIINNYGAEWNNVKVLTQEIKFSSPASSASKLKWTAGSYFFYQNVPNKQAVHFGEDAIYVGSPDINYSIINTTTGKNTGIAFFGQAVYSIANNVELIAGLRYDNEHRKLNVLGEYQPDASPEPVFETQPDTSASASFNAVSPMLSLAFHAHKNSHLYITYSRGFRAGGLTQLSSDPSQPPLYPYKPEYSNNFEAGIKNNFLNNHLRANIAVFYTSVTDAQTPTLILPDAITVTKNTGKLNSKGIEGEFAAATHGFEIAWN